MRPEGSPLDLNHLPEDFTRDGKQVHEDPSTSAGQRKKKSGGKEESGKVYECRFCSLKFCKSQALGGHMNRHRQERETETLNKARQLVYSSDNVAPQPQPHPHPHPGSYVPPTAVYHQQNHQVYPARSLIFSDPGGLPLPPPPLPLPTYHHHHQSCLYTSTPPPLVPTGDYYATHGAALTGSSPTTTSHNLHHQYTSSTNNYSTNNYTCIGAPMMVHGLEGSSGRDGSDQEGGLTRSWGQSYVTSSSAVGSDHLHSPY